MKHEENVTYELTPGQGDNDQNWNIRIIEGMFNETVVNVSKIAFNEEEEGVMSFDYHIVETPDTELDQENEDLQNTVGDILVAIITRAIENQEGIYGKHPDAGDDQWEQLSK